MGLELDHMRQVVASSIKDMTIKQVIDDGVEIESMDDITPLYPLNEADNSFIAYNFSISNVSSNVTDSARISLLSAHRNSVLRQDAQKDLTISQVPEKYVIRKG
jgi:hypothetical protein